MKNHNPGFLALVNEAKKEIRELSQDELRSWISKSIPLTLIDVREDTEWDKGFIPGAIHLCKGILERDIETTVPQKNRTLVLYCGGGFRSALAAYNLKKMGYTDVWSLAGGWTAWNN